MANRKITIKRAGKESSYLDYNTRCRFAVECWTSINAPGSEQVIELELMLQDGE